MLYISSSGVIQLTRGDTARLSVTVTNDNTGSEYYLESTDVLTLTVKEKATSSQVIFQKVVTGTNTFHIEPSDTADMSFKTYVYDIQINKINGDVYTIMEPTNFIIMQEVTW